MSEDILERAKKALIDDDMTYEDYDECISLLIAEVKRLRSENNRINKLREAEINQAGAAERVYLEAMMVKDARIADQEAYIERLEAAFLASEIKRLDTPDQNHTWYPGDESYVDFVKRVKREAEHKAREALERIRKGELREVAINKLLSMKKLEVIEQIKEEIRSGKDE